MIPRISNIQTTMGFKKEPILNKKKKKEQESNKDNESFSDIFNRLKNDKHTKCNGVHV